MRKLLTCILILVVTASTLVALVGCNNDCEIHLDENGDYICDNCGESIPNNGTETTDTPSNDDNDTNDDAPTIEVELVPKGIYTREKIGDIDYIYYGTLAQTVVSQELNSVLSNLVKTQQLAPNEKGDYTYSDKEYACVVGSEQTAGRRLTNGLTIVKGEYYFFNYEPIKWRVLEEKDGKALLLCENIVGESCFNTTDSYNDRLGTLLGTPNNANDYSVSALHTYVNETLFNTLFTYRERKSIYETPVLLRPGDSAFMITQGMYATNYDKMFIPSYREINDKYNLKVKGENSKVSAVEVKDYQVASGFNAMEVSGHYYASWWLRTSGSHINTGNIVDFNGIIGTTSECSIHLNQYAGVRPMITLRTA